MKLRLFALFLVLLLCIPPLTACGEGENTFVLYNKLNTDVSITLYSDGTRKKQAELISDCEELLDEAERVLSRTDLAAELASVNASSEPMLVVSPILADVLSRSLTLAAETGGCFDPTAGALSVLYDITGDAPLPPDPAALAAARETVGYEGITLNAMLLTRPVGTVLDFGAIAKGYLAERLVSYLLEAGVSGGVLSLGGNIATFGEKKDGNSFRIALRAPEGGYAGVLHILGEAYVSTSGAYERNRVGADGKTYHHIFDPATGAPAESDLASVTVVDEDGARADALSTALYVMGYEKALAYQKEHGDFEMLLILANGEIYQTEGLNFEST